MTKFKSLMAIPIVAGIGIAQSALGGGFEESNIEPHLPEDVPLTSQIGREQVLKQNSEGERIPTPTSKMATYENYDWRWIVVKHPLSSTKSYLVRNIDQFNALGDSNVGFPIKDLISLKLKSNGKFKWEKNTAELFIVVNNPVQKLQLPNDSVDPCNYQKLSPFDSTQRGTRTEETYGKYLLIHISLDTSSLKGSALIRIEAKLEKHLKRIFDVDASSKLELDGLSEKIVKSVKVYGTLGTIQDISLTEFQDKEVFRYLLSKGKNVLLSSVFTPYCKFDKDLSNSVGCESRTTSIIDSIFGKSKNTDN